MSRKAVFFVVFAVLSLAVGFAVLSSGEEGLRAFTWAASRMAWLFRVASLSVGQVVPWVLAVAGLAVTALATLRGEEAPAGRRRARAPEEERNRTAVWDARIAGACRNPFLRRPLEAELRRVASAVLLHADGVEAEDLPRFLAGDGSGLPEAVRRLFDAPAREEGAGRPRRLGFPRGGKDGEERAAAYGRWIADVVEFLERRMGGMDGHAD